jgi:KipI family sensor histidine kinase inhibitor
VSSPRAIRRLGDTAFRVAAGDMREAHGLGWSIEQQAWPGVEEVVVGHRTVSVVADPVQVDLGELAGRAATLPLSERAEQTPRTVEIPVVFDGADLEEVARDLGMSTEEFTAVMVGTELVVAMVGFVPGFGYLVGLPEPLASVPRRATPRPRVEAGSVALGGGYAGVYPIETPGGWQLVGRTALQLFDPHVPPFAVLQAGDRVRFQGVERVDSAAGERRRLLIAGVGAPSVRVLSPGTLTTVQDRGRIGMARLGVPRAGPADSLAARLANRAVGNVDEAALLEMTLFGARLRFEVERYVALVGDADLTIDGTKMADGAVHPVGAGQVVEVGSIGPGPRAFLAIGGGVESLVVLGSRSSDLLSRVGPGPLAAGDVLPLGAPSRARGTFESPERSTILRVLRGPDPMGVEAWARFEAASYRVAPRSDRTGIRLEAELPLAPADPVTGSTAMVTGAVQLPPDGAPIVLGVDHATLGGYPVVAVVVSADLARLGQLFPGDTVHFRTVDSADAARLRQAAETSLDRRLRGWYPVQAG